MPITEKTGFTAFCALQRQHCRQNCIFSDAYGGLKAALTQTPYLYRCPAGLMDCAVPILAQGRYLGAILMGQVRCQDASLEQLQPFTQPPLLSDPTLKQAYTKIATFSVAQLRMIAELFFRYIREMVAKQLAHFGAQQLKQRNQQLSAILTQQQPHDRHLLHQVLNAIGDLTAIETAPRANELVCLYATMQHYLTLQRPEMATLAQELTFVAQYLKVQQFCRPDQLTFRMTGTEDPVFETQSFPHLLLFTFVENAVGHGMLKSAQPGTVTIDVVKRSQDYQIVIADNGQGLTPQMSDQLTAPLTASALQRPELTMMTARWRLAQMFGTAADIQFQNRLGAGLTVTLTVPYHKR